MADTRLILHVAGTDAETQELPREAVKTAVAEGKLRYSQLIWSPVEQTWKQVRELPDLLPGESLILHVKGTESETREMPKQAVKNAISRGEITHSQLIWSAIDSTWKPVREIPDLLPGETLILHVKGTESETRELPKPAIRAAIQKGEISQTQLIWSPLDSAWKPVAEMPDLQPGESVILHVKGTTAETKEMPKKAIRTEIKEGKITHSQLIWSAEENRWKQVRESPELLPSQKLAPAPARRPQLPMVQPVEPDVPQNPVARAVAATPRPIARSGPDVVAPPRVTIAAAGPVAEGPQPKIVQPSIAGGQTPGVRVAKVATPAAEPRVAEASTPKVVQAARAVAKPVVAAAAFPQGGAGPEEKHVVREEDDGSHPLKWICIVVGVLVIGVVALNYLLVDRPLASNLGQTPYANVFVYAHCGGYFQPNAVLIYIPSSDKLTPENLPAFLVALARSTPGSPLSGEVFDRVALTSRLTGTEEYGIQGLTWKSLGQMNEQNPEDIKTQILSAVDAGRQDPTSASTHDESGLEAKRQQEWQQLVSSFCASKN